MKSAPSFFVGYLPAPADVRRFAFAAIGVVVAGFAAIAAVVGHTPGPVAPSQYGDELAVAGVMQARPYPLILAPPDAAHPRGHAIMLGGDGKRGAQDAAKGLDGREVHAKGALVKRGDLDMLLIAPDDVTAGPPAATPPPASLGRWRIHGEICDGKCAAGGMAPGAGLAHKACANLCVAGGLPPVLVSSGRIEGAEYLLLANADGGPVPASAGDLVAKPVALEGDVERRGDMLIFKVDWARARAE